MICESLLSSFSDSYFQGLLPAQNQFCRRVRKDAGFLTCPPFASALSANPAHQSGKHQRAATCCIQFGTGPAGRGKFVVGRIGLTGDHKAVGFYRLFGIIADGRIQNLDVIDYFTVNSRFANVLQLDGVADRIGACGNGGTGRTQGDLALIINIFPSDSERCIAVFHAELERVFDIFGGYAGGQGHAVRKRQRAGLFVLDHKRNSVIQVGIAAIIARVRHALVKVIVLIVFLILIGGFIRVDGDIKGVIFVDLDLIKAAAGDLALVPLEIEGNVAGDLGIGSIRACGCLLFLLDISLGRTAARRTSSRHSP